MTHTEPSTPWGNLILADPPPGTATRIIDAAMARFSQQGINATTMSQLATDVGISRVSLYHYYDNRDAVVVTLLGREAKRFLEDLMEAADPRLPVADAMKAAFEFAVVTLRGHELLQRVLVQEPQVAAPFVIAGIGPLLRAASDLISGHLQTHATTTPEVATAIADTLLRLALSIVVNNDTNIDFDDTAQRATYINQIITRLVP